MAKHFYFSSKTFFYTFTTFLSHQICFDFFSLAKKPPKGSLKTAMFYGQKRFYVYFIYPPNILKLSICNFAEINEGSLMSGINIFLQKFIASTLKIFLLYKILFFNFFKVRFANFFTH